MILLFFECGKLIVEIADHIGATPLVICNVVVDCFAVCLSGLGICVGALDVNAYESHQVFILR